MRKWLSDAGAPIAFAKHFEYARGDATNAGDLRPLIAGDAPAAVVYLALPPSVAAVAIAAVADARVVFDRRCDGKAVRYRHALGARAESTHLRTAPAVAGIARRP